MPQSLSLKLSLFYLELYFNLFLLPYVFYLFYLSVSGSFILSSLLKMYSVSSFYFYSVGVCRLYSVFLLLLENLRAFRFTDSFIEFFSNPFFLHMSPFLRDLGLMPEIRLSLLALRRIGW